MLNLAFPSSLIIKIQIVCLILVVAKVIDVTIDFPHQNQYNEFNKVHAMQYYCVIYILASHLSRSTI